MDILIKYLLAAIAGLVGVVWFKSQQASNAEALSGQIDLNKKLDQLDADQNAKDAQEKQLEQQRQQVQTNLTQEEQGKQDADELANFFNSNKPGNA
jgi:aconitase A